MNSARKTDIQTNSDKGRDAWNTKTPNYKRRRGRKEGHGKWKREKERESERERGRGATESWSGRNSEPGERHVCQKGTRLFFLEASDPEAPISSTWKGVRFAPSETRDDAIPLLPDVPTNGILSIMVSKWCEQISSIHVSGLFPFDFLLKVLNF